jgi:dihydropyrimidine dehydrogenase (NAD+) subunit PreA
VVVREPDCVGCRLCFNICPVENCIHMVEVRPEQPSITWDELTAKQPEVAEDWDQMERYRQKMGIRIH